MARIRCIKPEFWTDSKTGTLSGEQTKLFIGLLSFADDYGVINNDSHELKAKIFPFENPSTLESIPLNIEELQKKDLIIKFSVDKKQILWIKNFEKHQRVDRKGKPLIENWNSIKMKILQDLSTDSSSSREDSRVVGKSIEDSSSSREDSRVVGKSIEDSSSSREDSRVLDYGREGKGRERKGKERSKDIVEGEPSTSPSECLSELLFNCILKNNPESRLHACNNGDRRKIISKWAKDIELLLRKDQKEPPIVEEVIKFATGDGFWGANILSGRKLRDKWDTLVKLMRSNPKKKGGEMRQESYDAAGRKLKYV